MSRSVQISVIIPHFNQPDFLARCLASLAAQTGDVPAHEVIVVGPSETCPLGPRLFRSRGARAE